MRTGRRLIEDICRPIPAGALSFWWLGQMGFAVRAGDAHLYFDAFLSRHPQRVHEPVCAPGEVVRAGYIFGSHDHEDHIDRRAWPAMAQASPGAKFVVPRAVSGSLPGELGIPPERIIPISAGETVRDGAVCITGVASAHELLAPGPDGEFPCLGYIVEACGRRLYHSGDTCLYSGLEETLRAAGPFDVMFLPINGRDAKRLRTGCIGNMTYQEAADLFGALRPGLCVPGHYDMFAHNSADPLLFADYLDAKYPGLPCWIGAYGDQTPVPAREPADNRA